MASPTTLSAAEVAELATLARLALDADEAARMGVELGSILGVMAHLAEVDTAGIEPMTHVPDADAAALRPDEVVPSLPVAQAVGGAAVQAGDFFVVPVVIAGEAEA